MYQQNNLWWYGLLLLLYFSHSSRFFLLLESYYFGTINLGSSVPFYSYHDLINALRLKSPVIWNFLFYLFVLRKMQFRNISKGSDNPFGGLYKTLINVFWFFLHKSSIEIDSTYCSTVLLMLRSGRGLNVNLLCK